MRTTRFGAIAASTALAATTILGGAGIAQAEEKAVTFSASSNGDCTAEFTATNKTNSDKNVVHYWTGDDVPDTAPEYGENDDADLAITADAASTDENGDLYAPYSEADETEHQSRYVTGLTAVKTTAHVDFSDEVAEDGVVTVAYRMTGVERDDYNNELKTLDVTGCGGGGFLGSLDVFGSLGSMS